MFTDLDNVGLIARLDPSNMMGAVDCFPRPFKDRKGSVSELEHWGSFRSLVLMGMGGSASAGDLVLDWLQGDLKIPSFVHRDSGLPGFVGPGTLFVAISYSGATSETLTAFRAARSRRARVIGVGTGGELAALCARFHAPFIKVESTIVPRAALGQLVMGVTTALEGLGVIESTLRESLAAGRELEAVRNKCNAQVGMKNNPAKRFAAKLLGKFVVLYSLQRMSSVARRFKNQLAENSKEIAKYDLLPESCHNEIEAWRNPPNHALPIFIRDRRESLAESSIVDAFCASITSVCRVRVLQTRMQSRTLLARLLCPILFLDYVSVYLALLKGVDPTPTELIARYKRIRESANL